MAGLYSGAASALGVNLQSPTGQWNMVSPINQDATAPQRDAELQRQLLNSYQTSQPRNAPSATAAQAPTASQAGYQAAGSAGSSSYSPYTSERAPGAQQATYSPYSAALAPSAAQVDMTQLGQASLVRAPNIITNTADYVGVGPAMRADAPTVGYTQMGNIGQTALPEFVPYSYAAAPADMQAAQMAEAQRAQTSYAEAAKIGQLRESQGVQLADNDALRARQMSLLDYLEGSAKGTNGPSAAEMQFQRNLDKSIAAQRAQAAGANGTGRVSANLQAGYNIGELSQDANAQSAMLRAQEQQQARAQLLAGLSDTRGQDINIAGMQQQNNQFNAGQSNAAQVTQAQMQTDVWRANAQLETATSQFNAGQINAQQLAQAQLQQQAAMANLQKASSFSQFNAGQEQNMNQFRQDLTARVGMSNAGMTTQAALADQQVQAARAQQQAALQGNANLFNAGEQNTNERLQANLESTRGMFNAGQQNQGSIAQAGMQLQAGTFNAGAQNSFQQQQAALNSSERQFNAGAENQVNLFNTGQSNQVGMFNSGNQLQASQFNAGQNNAVNMFNTGQQNQVGLANASNSLQNSQFNIGQQNGLNQFNAGQYNNNSQFNTGQTNSVNVSNAGLQNQVNLANQDAALRQRALDDAQKQALMNQYLTATGLQQNAAQWEGQYGLTKRGQTMGLIGGLISGGAAIGGAIAGRPTSDERAKTDIKPLYSDERGKTDKKLLDHYTAGSDEDAVGAMLDNLHPSSYRYKDPSQPGTAPGQRYGIMAQDLEKSPMGRSIVVNEGGVKKIDPGQAIGVLMAAMARMNQKLKQTEGRR